MKQAYLLIILFIGLLNLQAQHNCGYYKLIQDSELKISEEALRRAIDSSIVPLEPIVVNLRFIVHSDSLGNTAVNTEILNNVADSVEHAFREQVIIDYEGYIIANNPELFDMEYYEVRYNETLEPYEAHPRTMTLNVHIVNNVYYKGRRYAGLAEYPPYSPSRAIVDFKYIWVTTIHEVLHIGGIGHTNGDGEELNDRSNCLTAGDRFCSTGADINVLVNFGCELLEHNMTDENGDLYDNVPINNYMRIYGHKHCRNRAEDDQIWLWKFLMIYYRSDGIITGVKNQYLNNPELWGMYDLLGRRVEIITIPGIYFNLSDKGVEKIMHFR